MIEESLEGVGSAGTLVPDPRFHPAPIVNGLIGLYRGDHVQLREALEVARRHMLGMLDPPAPVSRPILALDFSIEIQNGRNGGIADGVSADLQACGVGPQQPLARAGD